MSLRLEGTPIALPEKHPLHGSQPGIRALPPSSEPTAFVEVFERVVGPRLDAGEALMSRAIQGNMGHLEAPELIAIQAGIYRYTEALDLSSKLLDRATNSVRTVLQPGH